MQNKSKSLKAAMSRDIRMTGGGAPLNLDAMADRVANLLDATAVMGDDTVRESNVEFVSQKTKFVCYYCSIECYCVIIQSVHL